MYNLIRKLTKGVIFMSEFSKPNVFKRTGAALAATAAVFAIVGCSSNVDSALPVEIVTGEHGELNNIKRCNTEEGDTLLAIDPENIPEIVDKLGIGRLCYLGKPEALESDAPVFASIDDLLALAPDKIEGTKEFTCLSPFAQYLLSIGGLEKPC